MSTKRKSLHCSTCQSDEHTGQFGCPNDPNLIAEANERADQRTRRVVDAKREFAEWRAWAKTRKGPEPATPNLDAIRNQETIKEIKMNTTQTTVRFYRNGEPKPDRYNTFGRIGRRDGFNAASMRKLLADNGINEPLTTTWVFTMPSGVVVGAVAEGDDVPTELLVKHSKHDTETKPGKTARKGKGRKTQQPTPVVEIEQHGKQSFAVLVDGEQHGKRLPSRKQAEALVEQLTQKAA